MPDLRLENGVYELALSRKPLNEIGTEMLAGLEKALKEIDAEKGSALIVHSTLEGGFSAGADLRELYRTMLDRPADSRTAELRAFLDRIHNVMAELDALPLTTISVLHGVCFGGGFELALTTDIRIAEPSARFCFPELRLGILPCFGGIPRLKRDVGNAVVRDLLLTGRSFNARKAVDVGLVSQLVGPGEGLGVARRMARQTAKFDKRALREVKAFMKPLPREELRREKDLMIELFNRPVVIEALRKFVESTEVQPYLP